MKHRIVQTPNGPVEFTMYGQGIPLLFVHGGHSNCHETLAHKGFEPDRFLLITPSRPGYGQTPLLKANTPQQTAALFAALLDELEIEQVVLVGISAGGPAAIAFAAAYPARVRKLLLISAVTKEWLQPQDANYIKGKKLFNPSIEKYSWALFKLLYTCFPGLMAKTLFKELSTVREAAISKDEIQELEGMVRKQRSYQGFVQDLDQEVDSEAIARISCPTLIVHSLNDNSVPIAHAHYAHQKIKGSVLRTFNNAWGHLIWIGNDTRLGIEEIVRFSAGHEEHKTKPLTPTS